MLNPLEPVTNLVRLQDLSLAGIRVAYLMCSQIIRDGREEYIVYHRYKRVSGRLLSDELLQAIT